NVSRPLKEHILPKGHADKVKDLITHNVESLIMKDVKEVVFSCSGCYKTSLDDWPRYYEKEIPFKSTHITQFLARKVAEGEIRFKPLNKKITYHDPCHLGRHRGVYDEPREVLKAIPGVELVEMPFNRNRSRCCGAGAGVKAGYPQDALKIAKIRVQEAFDTGADILATSCVFCKYNFLDAKKELGLEIDIVNVEDLVIDLLITNGSSIEKESKPEEIEKKSELVLTNFNLYCGECKKWVPQPAKKIVQGNEVCEHCNHVLYFVPKCHDCGNAIIKPIGDFNAFRRDPPLCEKCGGRFFIQ
ncbi:MAG: (Fe-S)-binding protein, partial [Candidatus Hodarchaeota archaeon]